MGSRGVGIQVFAFNFDSLLQSTCLTPPESCKFAWHPSSYKHKPLAPPWNISWNRDLNSRTDLGVLPSVTMNRFLHSYQHASPIWKEAPLLLFSEELHVFTSYYLLVSILETSTDDLDSWELFIAGCASASLPQKPVGVSNLRTIPRFTYSQRHHDSWLFVYLAMILKNRTSF